MNARIKLHGLPKCKALAFYITLSEEQWDNFKVVKANRVYTINAMGMPTDTGNGEKAYRWTITGSILENQLPKLKQAVNLAIGGIPKGQVTLNQINPLETIAATLLHNLAANPYGSFKKEVITLSPYVQSAIPKVKIKEFTEVAWTYLLAKKFIQHSKGKFHINKSKCKGIWDSYKYWHKPFFVLTELHLRISKLKQLLDQSNSHWGGEDGFYRFYHQSFKVYHIQAVTEAALTEFQEIAKVAGCTLNKTYLTIVSEGTGKKFSVEHNVNWLQETRTILEAFFHTREFLKQAVKYANELKKPPISMPSGWAAVLYLFNSR